MCAVLAFSVGGDIHMYIGMYDCTTSVVASRVYPHASVVMRGDRVGNGQCDYHVDMFLYGQLHQEGFESESTRTQSFHTSSLPVFAALCTCSSTLAFLCV